MAACPIIYEQLHIQTRSSGFKGSERPLDSSRLSRRSISVFSQQVSVIRDDYAPCGHIQIPVLLYTIVPICPLIL